MVNKGVKSRHHRCKILHQVRFFIWMTRAIAIVPSETTARRRMGGRHDCDDGGTSLFELPVTPQLHILATNLSEGCLSSFNRSGLLMLRRQDRLRLRIERVPTGLATVAMAVAASSAFPGFFPPLVLTGSDVGTCAGEFGRQSFTDGGVFDNLGVRMFRCLEHPLLLENPLGPDDFVDFQKFADTLHDNQQSPNNPSPLSRLKEILSNNSRYAASFDRLPLEAPTVNQEVFMSDAFRRRDGLVEGLRDVLSNYPLQREPLFAALKLSDPEADALLQATRDGGQTLERGDQF
jgi:hypothetical protein